MEQGTSGPETFDIALRDVMASDLPIFFDQQQDPQANYMAAFTAKDPADREAFMARWNRILNGQAIAIQTILVDGQVAGSVSTYRDEEGRPEVTYWIGKSYWGKGVASRALAAFLARADTRPLYARAAKDNLASLRVLEKCGFTRIGQGRGYANARGAEIEEYLLKLD